MLDVGVEVSISRQRQVSWWPATWTYWWENRALINRHTEWEKDGLVVSVCRGGGTHKLWSCEGERWIVYVPGVLCHWQRSCADSSTSCDQSTPGPHQKTNCISQYSDYCQSQLFTWATAQRKHFILFMCTWHYNKEAHEHLSSFSLGLEGKV